MSSTLLSPFDLGSLKLRNRLVMAPMTRCRATADHVPTTLMSEYYAQRATGGLLITEGIAPDAHGAGYARIPGLWNEAQLAGWKTVTTAVHAEGGRICAQLMHCGRVSHPLNMPPGSRVLSPSATQVPGQMYTDQEGPQDYPVAEAMSGDDVEAAIAGIVTAAKNAIDSGFDFVEIHGANGYLVEQFLCPATNQRSDQFGGEFSNRARFALETVRRTADAIGANRLGIRLSPFGVFNGIQPWEGIADDYVWLAGKLSEMGLAYLHLVDHSSMGAPALPGDLKHRLRKQFSGAFILSGGYDKARAETDLAENRGDLVAFGRPFLANPDLVRRLEVDAELNAPDTATFYTPGAPGYTDYPTLDGR